LTVQLPLLGHEVLQSPPEQSIEQGSVSHQVRQWLPEQSSLHGPPDEHVSSQLPPEQSGEHGLWPAHWSVQFPSEQSHELPLQASGLRAPASPGSGTSGPPFGVPVEQARQKTNGREARIF
jgi:hypothetical protein